MALEPYSSCPCGSGKKFKWCCQPIYLEIDKAVRQDEDGQHEAALHTMEQLTAAHPENPEAWGRRAELLYRNGKVEEAENALGEAFKINPKYPFGFLLQGLFRQEEGEIAGALLLFRKAADAYDPEARDQLAHVYALIGSCEMRMNRPVAARAAWQISARMAPANEQLRQALDHDFGEQSPLPISARREYRFLAPPPNLAGERRAAWDEACSRAATGKLGDAARAFGDLTQQDASNAPAWYNLAVSQAWLGDNSHALEALDRYVALEADETQAAAAWSLGEVLRLGHGMDKEADILEYAVYFQVRDGRQVSEALSHWQSQNRLLVLDARKEQAVLSALILERPTGLVGTGAAAPPHIGAYILIVADRIRVWNTSREPFDRVRQELEQLAGSGLSGGPVDTHPGNFADVLSEALVIPVDVPDKTEGERVVREHLERFFEEKWIHRPLHALNGVPPVDAAGHGTLRKKLRGVVQFRAEAGQAGHQPYDFDRLRRKLGLLAPEGGAAAPSGSTGPDIGAMSAADLAGLNTDTLGEEQLEQAYQAAQKLDARELAGKFAKALVAKPAPGQRPDRFPWYQHLIQLALQEGNTDAALATIGEAAKVDAEHNDGRRRNDYELRRAQILIKRGEADAAQEAFEQVIARAPEELRYRGSAAEAMLSSKQGKRALKFAEEGLAQARKQNNRDSEQYFLELAAAARKQSG